MVEELCTHCGQPKLLNEFYKNKTRCKVCMDEATNRWRKNNPERYKQHMRKCNLKKFHHLTVEQYNELFNQQNGSCFICGRHQKDLKQRLCVDHNHETGELRKLLCNNCNRAIGYFRDDAELCLKAYNYLRR